MTFLTSMPYKALGKAQAIIPSGTMKKKDNNLSSPELKNASQGENSINFVVTSVINVQLILNSEQDFDKKIVYFFKEKLKKKN